MGLCLSYTVTELKIAKESEIHIMKLGEERGERRWFVVAIMAILLVLLSGLATAAFLLSYEVSEDGNNSQINEVEGYPTLEEVVNQMKEAEKRNSKLVRVEVIGRSLEGRPIHSVSVNGNVHNKGPLVWLICGLHAREWVSTLACMHIIQALIQDLPSEPELQKVAFHIVTLANPDGYVFTMAGEQLENRLKRKNMADSGCPDPIYNGIDLNRNFPVGFNLSTNSNCVPIRGSRGGFCGCSNTYGGQHPFSEPETAALRSALTQAPPWLFIDIHASLGAWLTPPVSRFAFLSSRSSLFPISYNHTRHSRPGEHPDAWNLDFLTEFLKSKFNVKYSTGPANSMLGEVGGTMLDWVYEELRVDRAYALELVSGCQGHQETPLCLFQCPVKVARERVLPPVWAALKMLVKEASRQDFSSHHYVNQSLQQNR